jgi:hypothetical protein
MEAALWLAKTNDSSEEDERLEGHRKTTSGGPK